MGPWVILLFYAVPLFITARLVALLADPESSWTRIAYLAVKKFLHGLRTFDDNVPRGRPIEQIAHDVRRLSRQLRHSDNGRSAARIGALLASYDAALAECCAALGYVQLLSVIPPGPEQDAERRRVEQLLSRAGLVLEETG